MTVLLSLSLTALAADHPDVVQVQMRNIAYRVTNTVSVHIAHLDGELRPTKDGSIPTFDDRTSFLIAIRSAEISLTTDSLAALLNQYAFAASDAPLKDIRITAQDTRLKIEGKLHAKGNLPFETLGTLSVTPEGKVRIHTEHVKAAHISVKGLMDLLGLKLANLIKTEKLRGLRLDQDDLILDPTAILPDPHVEGRLTAIAVRGNQIAQTFGGAPPDTHGRAGNFMSYQGGQLRFGKLTMSPTDLVLIDPDPRDSFDFFFQHYKDQLDAGYTKTTPQDGLRVYMPDYGKLKRKAALRAD